MLGLWQATARHVVLGCKLGNFIGNWGPGGHFGSFRSPSKGSSSWEAIL